MDNLNEKLEEAREDNVEHELQVEQLEFEIEALLKINVMYQGSMKKMEGILGKRDAQIKDLIKTVYTITEGNANDLKGIKTMFFSKN